MCDSGCSQRLVCWSGGRRHAACGEKKPVSQSFSYLDIVLVIPTDTLDGLSQCVSHRNARLWPKRRADLEVPSVGRSTHCVAQCLLRAICESLTSLSLSLSFSTAQQDRNIACSGLQDVSRVCMGLVKCRMMRPVPVRLLL